MRLLTEPRGVLLTDCPDFSPALTFGCGQCFRFEEVAHGVYRGIAHGRKLDVSSQPEGTLIHCTQQEFEDVWRNYFDLNLDYGAIRQAVSITPFMAEAVDFGRGLRIVRQDFWEATCSFLLSQCNNIPRIKGLIARLCARYGDPIDAESFAFPSAERIARLSAEDMYALGAGYRAPYLIDAARAIADRRLSAEMLDALPFAEAKRALMTVSGIGAKVADCVLLYGLHRCDAFPIDVWMKRALTKHFPARFDPASFGPYAGIAQQYIFHYVRHLHGKAG